MDKIWPIISVGAIFVIAITGWIISWKRGRKAREISKRQHEEDQEAMKKIASLMENLISTVTASPTSTPEQKELMISTAQSVMNIIDFTAGETVDMGPGRTGG